MNAVFAVKNVIIQQPTLLSAGFVEPDRALAALNPIVGHLFVLVSKLYSTQRAECCVFLHCRLLS